MKKFILFGIALLLLVPLVGCQKVVPAKPELLPYDNIMDTTSSYVVVWGDLQNYTTNESNMKFFEQTAHWVYSQIRHKVKIKGVLQVGDITNVNMWYEWQNYKKTVGILENIVPVVLCPGNHDYTWGAGQKINGRDQTAFNDYIDYDNTATCVVSRFEEGKNENVIAPFKINRDNIYIVSLEFGPRDEVVQWADEYIKAHDNETFIVMTHEYLTAAGERIVRDSYAERQFRNTSVNNPQKLWEKLIANNKNVVSVLCGHNGFAAKLFSRNDFGCDVPQILFNIQAMPNGGDSWVQLWQFPNDGSRCVNVVTYNIDRKEVYDNPAGTFSFSYGPPNDAKK